ncbi:MULTISPECIES: YtxH domain-containing protein [Vagococcus]|uniref:General stress protein n=1 Tax=Vagococcus fluvialis bH819 TaxID=1255619 RepID=A0A1X6WR05_9ENTE|nr:MULTISPECIES: YtxH domain-containing protein [Vagococcus]SLM86773.1 general stress protein [Vagococcus fluvialis bH819]HCM88767.1 YtxH domain-containing protein [Vagococcus sp.]
MSKKSNGFLVGAIIGGAAAAAAALLLAPKSGKKMREDLIDQLDGVSEGKASEYAGIAQVKGNEFSDYAKQKKEAYSWVGDKVTSHVDQAKTTSNELLEGLKEKTSDIQDDFKRTSSEVRGKVNDLTNDDIVLKDENISEELYSVLENTEK